MNPIKNILLWASENETLRRHVSKWGFVKRALRQFMPGETFDDALNAAHQLKDQGLLTTFSELGEHLVDISEADAVVDHYLSVYDRSAAEGLVSEVSLKLTHLGLDLEVERCAKHLDRLAAKAEEHNTWLWIDMESSEYVDTTLDLYHQVMANHSNVGICLQAYLHRTPADVESLLPLKPGIRLVKGAYKEPASVVVRGKKAVDHAYFTVAAKLLTAARDGEVRLGLGTHDVHLIEKLDVVATTADVPRASYEIQMLYGIRTADQLRLAGDGHRVRTVIGYGEAWYPWYLRRLAEKPGNLWFVLRNVFGQPPTAD